jgi:hypothetical protein
LQKQKKIFFFFLWALLLSNLVTFLIFFQWFKMLKKCHLKFYKSSLNFNSNIHTRNFFGCLGTSLCSIQWFVFLNSWSEGCNFLNSIFFWMIYNVPNASIKFFLDTKNNGALPLDLAYHEHLSVWSPVG